MAQGYRRRIASNVVQQQQRDPRAFSSPVGDGLEALGSVMAQDKRNNQRIDEQARDIEHRIEMQELDRARSRHTADRAAAFVEVEARIKTDLTTLRGKGDPGAPEHEQAAKDLIESRWSEFASTLGDDPEVLDRFGPMVARASTTAKSAEEDFALVERVKKEVGDIDAWVSATTSGLVGDYSAENLQAKLGEAETLIGGLSLPGNAREEKVREVQGSFVKTAVASAIDGGQYDGARQMLESGAFDAFMDGDDKRNLLKLAGNAEATAHREAELAVEVQKDAVRDQIATVKAAIEAGATEYPALQLQALLEQGQAAGLDQSELFDIGLEQLKSKANQTYDTLPKVQSAITALGRKDDLGVEDQILLSHLTARRKAMSSEVGAGFKEAWVKGGQSRLGVVQQLYAMPPEQRLEAARAVDTTGQLAAAVRLENKGAAANAALGMEIRKANPRLVPSDKAAAAERIDLFDEYVGDALGELSATRRSEVLQTATNIYAYMADQKGFDEFDAPTYRAAINQVLGGQGGAGGVGDFNGHRVWLPSGVSASTFDRAIAREDFANAREPEQVKRKGVPYWVGDLDDGRSIYQFRDSSGAQFMDKSGKPLRLYVGVKR